MHAPPKPDVPVITVNDLKDADGFLFGIPTRFGTMPAQLKAFFDATGGLWALVLWLVSLLVLSSLLPLNTVVKKPLLSPPSLTLLTTVSSMSLLVLLTLTCLTTLKSLVVLPMVLVLLLMVMAADKLLKRKRKLHKPKVKTLARFFPPTSRAKMLLKH